MSSSWTQVRRLPARRVLAVTQVISAVAVFAVINASADGIALADRIPAAGVRGQRSNPVNDLFNALSRCQMPLGENERWRLAGTIEQESRQHGYDPMLVMAMIQVESACSPSAQGEKGGIGLVQIKPSTARAVAREAGLPWQGAETLKRPVLNVKLGLLYLAQLEDQFGDLYLAMVAFNKGPARVGNMSRQRARGARYVKKIMARYEDLTDEAAADAEEAL
jgi:soluble lytic murein transglycosylase-like protein